MTTVWPVKASSQNLKKITRNRVVKLRIFQGLKNTLYIDIILYSDSFKIELEVMKTYNIYGAFPPPDLPIQRSKMKYSSGRSRMDRDDPVSKTLSRGDVSIDYEAQSGRRSEGSGVGIKAGAFRSVWKKSRSLRKPHGAGWSFPQSPSQAQSCCCFTSMKAECTERTTWN